MELGFVRPEAYTDWVAIFKIKNTKFSTDSKYRSPEGARAGEGPSSLSFINFLRKESMS